MLAGIFASSALFGVGYVYGGLKRHIEGWMLDGPLSGIAGALVYGGYARTLGEMLERGTGLTEGLRLCQKSSSNTVARERLEGVSAAIRQGQLLSEDLRQVKGFPRPIIKLAEVGETSGALGPMLARAGIREESEALLRINRLSKRLGPS